MKVFTVVTQTVFSYSMENNSSCQILFERVDEFKQWWEKHCRLSALDFEIISRLDSYFLLRVHSYLLSCAQGMNSSEKQIPSGYGQFVNTRFAHFTNPMPSSGFSSTNIGVFNLTYFVCSIKKPWPSVLWCLSGPRKNVYGQNLSSMIVI